MTRLLARTVLAALVICAPGVHAADASRQAEVAKRSQDVMPFSLDATRHIFTKTADGGLQRVVAKDPADATQVGLVRAHLHAIETQFRQGDFSGPAHVHGADMPGLAQLRAARPGALAIAYQDVDGGAELKYATADAALVEALHAWFDAQLSDHGAAAMAGHHHGPAAMAGHHHTMDMSDMPKP